jgi:antitoxin (DNA-binding transcriptional repressor) of toxin-antitoxin stability system
MKTVAISEFKAHALQMLADISESKEGVIVTKRGKPLAEVCPYCESDAGAGRLANSLVFEKDIVSPLGEDDWDACK